MKKKYLRVGLFASVIVAMCGCNVGGYSSERKDTELYDYEAHKDERINIHGWNLPALECDSQKGYDTERNAKIVQDFLAAGMNIVHLTGANLRSIGIGNEEKVQTTREIIEYLGSQGVQSVIFGSNTGETNENSDFSKYMPDYSDLKDLYGFLVWDEPTKVALKKIGDYADIFESKYASSDTAYYVNLFPSYASCFASGGYDEYFEEYGERVLKKLHGTKIISVDSYPLRTDKTLGSTYLYDLIM